MAPRSRFLGVALLLMASVGLATTVSGCGDEPPGTSDEMHLVAGGLAATSITSKKMFEQLAFPDAGVILPGRTLKFLIDARASSRKPFYMNAGFKENGKTPEAAKFHFPFAERVLSGFSESNGSFNDATYFTEQKKYFAGSIQSYELESGVLYGIQFYPQDVIREGAVVDAVKVIKKTFKIPKAKLAFVATGPQQTTAEVEDELAALGVKSMTIDEVLAGITYIPMHQAEAWGYLRIFPQDEEDLSALDIPVFDELPLDLAVVAGTITKAFQDPSCHVNLKSKERGTANMVLRDAGPEQPDLAPFANKPIHLTVAATGFTIEPSTDAEVKAKLAERMNKPWTELSYEPTDALPSYAEMCPTNPSGCIAMAKKYGSKAAHLGFLTNSKVLGRVSNAGSPSAKVGYDIVAKGIGVPLKFYKDFVAHPPNAALRDAIDALIEDEKAGTLSGKQRSQRSLALQELFYQAEMPPGLAEDVRAELEAAAPGIVKFKVRSSANAEDLPNFDGAGLYSSYSANLTKVDNPDGSCKVVAETGDAETKTDMSPKTLACALKGVYASVWNKRAIEERSFARLEHASAAMGIAIVPKYDLEAEIAANSVVVTRVINSDGVYGYTFSMQQGNNLVTNPTPGTQSEVTLAAFLEPEIPATFVVTRFATPVANAPPLTKNVLTKEQMQLMLELTQKVETEYCKAKPSYYPNQSCANVTWDLEKPTALDLEFKILENGKFIAKQVREFSGH